MIPILAWRRRSNSPSVSHGAEPITRPGLFAGVGRNVAALGLVSLLTDVGSEMIYPLLPVFLTVTLGLGTAAVGLIEGVAESTASFLRLVSGWLSDRLGRRKALVVCGYGVSALTRPLLALSGAGWQVLLLRFADRLGKGVRGAPRDALIAAVTAEADRGKAYGFHRAMDHLGAAIGPLLAAGLLGAFALDYRTLFLLASIPGFLAVATVIVAVREAPPPQDPPRAVADAPGRARLDRRVLSLLGCIVLFTLGNSSDAFLLLRARELGLRVELLPILWFVLHVVKSLASMPAGAWSDRIGRPRVILAGWLLYALTYAGMAMASAGWHVWALFVVYGAYFALTEGVERALVADLAPPEARGTAFGAYYLAIGIAALPASLLTGFLWQAWGSAVAFGTGATFALAAAAWFAVAFLPARSAR